MTDKQIIIDGIDVSGCVAFKYDGIKKPLCRAGGITSVYKSCLCADNSNCYYKQLKRKEQECERLKEEIDYLKEIIQRHDNDNNALLSEFEDDLVDYYRRHKECLTEIKEIAEKISLPMGTGKSSNRVILANQILQKISECEANNDR